MAKANQASMLEGNPTKPLLLFALPLIGGNLFQQFYSIADSIIVGQFVGTEALAAVGASAAVTALFIMVAIGSGIGCSVVISRLYGGGKLEDMKTAISTALISILIFSIVLAVIGIIVNNGLLRLMGTPENIFVNAALFLAVYFYGFPFMFLYNACSAIFNSLGDSKKPLIFLAFSSLLNIGLDLLFVAVFHWGIAGAAWATLIAQALSAVMSLVVLIVTLKKVECGSYRRFDKTMLARMARIAVPTIIQQSIVSVGFVLIQSAVNRVGSVFLAGYTAAVRIDSVAIVPLVAVGNAMSTFTAQNMGAGRTDRIPKGYRVCVVMGLAISLLIAVLFQFTGEGFVGLFMDADSYGSIAVGAQYIGTVSLFYFILALMNVNNGVLRGAADMKWFLSATLANLAIRVILTYALVDSTGGMIIRWANPVGWTLGLSVGAFRFFQGGWKKKTI